jgi:hypothetical protein
LVSGGDEPAGAKEYTMTIAFIARSLTSADLTALQEGAAQAGDYAQVRICARALGGSTRARFECARVIHAARAME